MRGQARGRWIDEAITAMCLSNQEAGACLRRFGASACTDVTGFGLLGHLLEMTKASNMDAVVHLEAVPLLDGAAETVAAGILSSLQPQNLRLRRGVANPDQAARHPRFPLLFDPQTAGGLLAGIPRDRADACIQALRASGYPQATVIGRVDARGDAPEPVRLIV
jgi:selenide,water dikinase